METGTVGILREQGEYFDHKPLSEKDRKVYEEQQREEQKKKRNN